MAGGNRRRGGRPLHYILGNDTLTELARRRPKTREELLAVKGIGPVKAERYGAALLEIIGDSEKGEEEEGRGKKEQERDERTVVPGSSFPARSCAPHPSISHYWTCRLLSAGFSVEECAAIRGQRGRPSWTTPAGRRTES